MWGTAGGVASLLPISWPGYGFTAFPRAKVWPFGVWVDPSPGQVKIKTIKKITLFFASFVAGTKKYSSRELFFSCLPVCVPVFVWGFLMNFNV